MRRNDDSDHDRLPMDQLFANDIRIPICLVLAMFAQGLSHNMVFAHLEDLNTDFGHPLTRARLGSAFLTANGIANLFWGQIWYGPGRPFPNRTDPVFSDSDKYYGQRFGVLTSLLFQAIGTGVMASAKTLDWAIAGRVLSGISANVTLTRAYAGRTSNSSNQPRAYSLIIGAFGAAVSMVPLCAWIPDQNEIGNNSAAVTGWIVSGITWVTLLVCAVFLPYLPPPARVVVDVPRPPRTWSEHAHGLGRTLWDYKLCFLAAISYSACTLLLQAPDHVIITQTVQRPSLKWLFSVQGLVRMLFTLFLYPYICGIFSVVQVTKFAVGMMILTVPATYLTSLIGDTTMRHAAEVAVFAVRGINLSMGLTGGAQLVNNASPPRCRTTITGLSQSVASLSQTALVTLIAFILLETNHTKSIPFLFLTILAVVAAIVVYLGIPERLSKPNHAEQVVQVELAKAVQMESFSVDKGPPPPIYEVAVATPNAHDRQRL